MSQPRPAACFDSGYQASSRRLSTSLAIIRTFFLFETSNIPASFNFLLDDRSTEHGRQNHKPLSCTTNEGDHSTILSWKIRVAKYRTKWTYNRQSYKSPGPEPGLKCEVAASSDRDDNREYG